MAESVRKELNTNGYAVIEGFLTPQEIDLLKNEADELIKSMPEQSERQLFFPKDAGKNKSWVSYLLDSADKISYFYESGALDAEGQLLVDPSLSLNKIGHALHELNPVFKKISLGKKVKECALQLGFEDPAIVQSMYIFKSPGIGSKVAAHQDSWYIYTEPMTMVGFWFALDDATIENGCLWFVQGSHKNGVHVRYIKNPDGTAEELTMYNGPRPEYEKDSFTPVPVPKGSLTLIHGDVVHLSEDNKSQKSRHSYTFHIIEQKDTRYSEENWLQPGERGFLSLFKN